MALTAQPPAPPSFGRWHEHQHAGSEYILMGPTGMVPYDSRNATSAPVPRASIPSPHYVMGTVGSYSMAPMNSLPAPHYHHQNTYSFNSYTPPSPAPMTPSFRSYTEDRLPLPNSGLPCGREVRSPFTEDPIRSPLIKSEIQMPPQARLPSSASQQSSSTCPPTPGQGAKGEDTAIEFHTEIDELMKQIQSKENKSTEEEDLPPSYMVPQTKPEPISRSVSPDDTQSSKTRKKYICSVAGCFKRFAQKTHLVIHQRSHTGEKPYMCKQPGCGLFFSQLGNLKTHERRHTGERPYQCDICGKSFAQRGNVRAHKAVHDPRKKYHCRLDDCQKPFSQLGNLKSHQNRFHGPTLKVLTTKFATMTPDEIVSSPDRELFEYFATLYKNCNKGIKGRGKDRKVGSLTQNGKGSHNNSISHYPVQQPTPPMHHHPPHHVPHLPPPIQTTNLPAYAMSRSGPSPNNHPMMVGRDTRYHGYEIFDVDQESMNGSQTASSTTGSTLYEEEHHGREMHFGERIY